MVTVYEPGAPGRRLPADQRELQRISAAQRSHRSREAEPDPHAQYRLEQPHALLYGTADAGTVNTGFRQLTNYSSGSVLYPDSAALPPVIDQAAGTIQIRETGVYRIVGWMLAQQGGSAKEEQLKLWLNAAGQDRGALGVFDIATDKTTVRYLCATLARGLPVDTYWLELSATANLGDFGEVKASFELERLA